MDWKYKTFNFEAVFKAPQSSVLAAARQAVAESLPEVKDTPDGFVARGYLWHTTQATVRAASTADATRVTVELRVQRTAGRYFLLWDPFGYYAGRADKWFNGIAQQLTGGAEPALVSKTTSNVRIQRGCLAGLAIPLDQAVFGQSSASGPGPLTVVASLIGLAAGVDAFLYFVRREAGK